MALGCGVSTIINKSKIIKIIHMKVVTMITIIIIIMKLTIYCNK